MSDRDLKTTPLHSRQRALGARMVEFAGWEMPVQYRGIDGEHAAVRESVGLFDVSHMGQVQVTGPAAFAFSQQLTSNDVARIGPLQAQYTVLLNEQGGVIDDLVIYRLAEDRFLLCVNASRTAADVAWLAARPVDGTTVKDVSDAYALLALQGPLAEKVLQRHTDLDLGTIGRFHFAFGAVAQVQCLVSRTGYTGEDGFELYCDSGAVPRLWDNLLAAGGPIHVEPIGLGARDTLRLEKGFPLYGHELDEQTTPLEAGLGWVVRLHKGAFMGREALLRQKEKGIPRKLVGLEMLEPGIARRGYGVRAGGSPVGTITSGTRSPTLGKAIALAYVSSEHALEGMELEVTIRGRQRAARIAALPFV